MRMTIVRSWPSMWKCHIDEDGQARPRKLPANCIASSDTKCDAYKSVPAAGLLSLRVTGSSAGCGTVGDADSPSCFPPSAILVFLAQTPRRVHPFFTIPSTLLIFSYDSARQSSGWSTFHTQAAQPPFSAPTLLPAGCCARSPHSSHVSLLSSIISPFNTSYETST